MNSLPITREEAIALLKSMPQLDSDMNHYLETEAIMRALAERFGEDVEYWGMLGLLHDADWALTRNDVCEHCILAVEMLRAKGFGDAFIEDMQSHGYGCVETPKLQGKGRNSKLQHSLVAAETLTGIIYAYALMRGKKISDMAAKGLKKKFGDKNFAANCNRDRIREIELAGLTLDSFFDLAITAVRAIKGQVGLG